MNKLCPGCFPGDEDAGSFDDLCPSCQESLRHSLMWFALNAYLRRPNERKHSHLSNYKK